MKAGTKNAKVFNKEGRKTGKSPFLIFSVHGFLVSLFQPDFVRRALALLAVISPVFSLFAYLACFAVYSGFAPKTRPKMSA
jgi:hypothetical protein